MENSVKNKAIVVTGGATGIGYEIADNFLKNGAKLAVLLDINTKEGEKAVEKLSKKHGKNKVAFLKCDVVKDLNTVAKKIIETYKTIDVLVNNAGVLREPSVNLTIDINVTALMQWSLKFWEHMRKDLGGKGGTILNLASIYGFRPEPHLPVYQASKFAVYGFNKALGHKVNYDKTGVRVVAICPGFTETVLTTGVHTIDDDLMAKDLNEYLKAMPWQTVDVVGAAAVEIFEKADSGAAWMIEGGKPVSEVVINCDSFIPKK